MPNTYSFLRELRRRKVFRGAAIYLVGAWLVLQVLDVIAEPAGLPPWTLRVALYLSVIGFPLAVFVGWRYEFGENGLVVTQPESASIQDGRVALGVRDYIAITAITVVSAAVAWQVVPKAIESVPEPETVEAIAALPNSIAVIPFREPGSSGDGFLADGLVDTVTFMLAQVDGLVVTARTSAYAFKGSDTRVPDIARQLNVSYVLEGSVQQIENRVQIIATLIDARSGLEVWSNRFFREVSDIFAIQDEIASEVVVALGDSIDLGDDRVAEQYRPVLEAFEQVINGRNAQYGKTVDGILQAQQHFERAIELDPNYAVAYVELAANYMLREDTAMDQEGAARMRELVDKALELDPLSAEAYSLLGFVLRQEQRNDEIEPAMLKAIELNPNLVDARTGYATWLMILSRHDESLEQARMAQSLDPANSDVLNLLAQATWNVAQSERAISIAKDTLRRFPEEPNAYNNLSRWLQQMGRLGDSMRYVLALYELDPDSLRRLTAVCQAWEQMYDIEQAIACREEAVRRFPDDLENQKQIAARRGDFAEAARLSRLHAELEPWFNYRKVQLAFFLEVDGQFDAVVEVLATLYPDLTTDVPAINNFTVWPAMMMANALMRTGNTQQSEYLLIAIEELVNQARLAQGSGWMLGIEPAQIAAIRGDADQAIELLADAVERGWTFYSSAIFIDPKFDFVRDDVRYQAVEQSLLDYLAEQRRWYEENKDKPLW